jgi:hypothetical protein
MSFINPSDYMSLPEMLVMDEKEGFISMAEANHEVEVAMTRLALLHLSFSKTS